MIKSIFHILPLCLMIACGLAGCSKPNKAAEPLPKPVAEAVDPNQPVTIKLKWIVDKKYLFRMETLLGLNTTLPEPLDPKTNVIGLNHDYSVSVAKSLDSAGPELDLAMTAEKLFYQMAERNYYTFDSRQNIVHDTNDPVSPLLRGLLDGRLRCFTDTDGKLVKVQGFDAITARLDKGDPQIKGPLEAIFSEKNFREIFDSIAAAQPADPVKIGGTWPVHVELEAPTIAGVIINATCTPAEWKSQGDRQCVRIEFQGQVTAKPDAPGESSLSTIDDGTISGKAWFDPALGMVVNSRVEEHMTLKTSALGQKATTRVNVTANLQLLSLEDK